MELSPHFTLAELSRTDTGIANEPGVEEGANLVRLAVYLLEPIRERLGGPMIVHSGFRCPDVNRRVGGDRTSAHMFGRACDFAPQGMSCQAAFDLIRASNIPFDKMLLEEHGGSYWIHVQIAPQGMEPRGKCYIAQVTDTGTAYREVPRG